jgi:hypothetical protein
VATAASAISLKGVALILSQLNLDSAHETRKKHVWPSGAPQGARKEQGAPQEPARRIRQRTRVNRLQKLVSPGPAAIDRVGETMTEQHRLPGTSKSI